MKKLILFIILFVFIACNKEEVEPIGFTKVNYVTKSDEAQVFDYFYDDGKYVAGGLDEYVASIRTQSGTFDTEQLLLMTFRRDEAIFPDSLIPFTYALGTNYIDSTNKAVEYRINLDYPYNNIAHQDYHELQFFKANIDKMHLYRIKTEGNGSFYYDPNIEINEIAFSTDKSTNDIVFETHDLKSAYALCWKENPWKDSIYIEIKDGAKSNIINIVEAGARKRSANSTEGALLRDNYFLMQYTYNERVSVTETSFDGWKIDDLYITINQPKQGAILKKDISLSLLIKDKNGIGAVKTYLKILNSTNIEIVQWPDYGKKGVLRIYGWMQIEAYQRNVQVDLKIKFTRQR